MTGYTVHTGSTEKFSAGWDEIFRRGSSKKTPAKKKPARKKTTAKKARATRQKKR